MLRLRIGDSCTCVAFGVALNIAVPMLLGRIFIDRFIKSVHPAERITFPYHSLTALILLVHETRKAADKKEASDIRNFNAEDLDLLVALTVSKLESITVACEVILKAVWETSVLVSTWAAVLVEVIHHDNTASNYACMTEKKNMNVYPGQLFNKNIANFGKVDVHLPKHQKFGEVGKVPVKIFHVKAELTRSSLAHVRIAVKAQSTL